MSIASNMESLLKTLSPSQAKEAKFTASLLMAIDENKEVATSLPDEILVEIFKGVLEIYRMDKQIRSKSFN